jgi:hypothetical protein
MRACASRRDRYLVTETLKGSSTRRYVFRRGRRPDAEMEVQHPVVLKIRPSPSCRRSYVGDLTMPTLFDL